MTRALVALVALVLVFSAATVAQAQQTNAPAGNSAIDEYLETVPGASGNKPPQAPKKGGGALTAAQRAALARRGADGRALADAVDATASAPSKPSSTGKPEAVIPDSSGRSPASEILGTVSGSDGGGGMGIALPAILVGALLAALAVVLLRRRSAS